MRRRKKGSYKMYDYYIDQMWTDFNEARTAWETIKTQLDEVYVLDHISVTYKTRITRGANNIKGWFNKVEKLMNRLPEDGTPSVGLLFEIRKKLELEYLKAFPPLCCTVSDLPISEDRKGSIAESVQSINDYVDNMKNDLQGLLVD